MCTSSWIDRTVQPWHTNVGKRVVKRPKVYIRDSGLLHALLGIRDLESLLGNPIVGASWEGFVMQQIIACVPSGVSVHYPRTYGGAGVDIVLALPGGKLWAIEVKRSTKPSPRRGFHEAISDIKPSRSIVVYAGTERQTLRESIEVMSLMDLIREIQKAVQ
ncbi:MAG: ATP-binding protein [Bacteroidota bacterium]